MGRPSTLALLLLAAAGLAACTGAGKMREAVVVQEAPMLVWLRPAHFGVVSSSASRSGYEERPAPEWEEVTRAVYEVFRNEFGDDRVTLLEGPPARRIVEGPHGQRMVSVDWPEFDGAVLIEPRVRGGFKEGTGHGPVSYDPFLRTEVELRRIHVNAPGLRERLGSVWAEMEMPAYDDFEPGEFLSIDDAFEHHDLRQHADELLERTRQRLTDYLAKVQSGD